MSYLACKLKAKLDKHTHVLLVVQSTTFSSEMIEKNSYTAADLFTQRRLLYIAPAHLRGDLQDAKSIQCRGVRSCEMRCSG